MATREQLEQALRDPNVRRYLDLIAYAEGVKHGYNTTFGNNRWDDLSQHPNKVWGRTGDGATTATGRYQFIGSTWNNLAKKYGFDDFGAKNQDLGAIALIAEKGALKDVMSGNIDSANRKLSKTWESLPYNDSPHQSQRSTAEIAKEWNRLGGTEYSPVAGGDYNQSVGITNAAPNQQANSFLPQPQNIGEQMASLFTPPKTDNAFTNYFEQINGTLDPLNQLESTQPKISNRQKYQQQLADAFGIEPKVGNGLPDYISGLVQSIYDTV